ncbi:cell division protein FtsX [Tannerella forsythia]|uniref:cell division protein FtsX n=1 Tax=Tannerella forsythia TaxID=28112 RepID=UPI00094F7CDB|nr:permease-like cell division protein FtsX [Tannerella forsythia]OLQ20654.1 cell division protein FtsX [Tannerella forsythia]
MTASKKKAPISFFNSRLISVISIALALYMMGLFFIFGLISKELSVYMKENIAFSILLKEDIKEADIRQMERQLNAQPFIKSAKYISKEEAAREMVAELGEDPQMFLGINPFQASMEVKLKSAYANPDSLQQIEKKLTSYTNVSELLYQKDIMQVVNNNVRRIGLVLFMLITILVLISFVLISNTIRLLIYSKRFLVYTMRLVGATPAFIRRPFIRYNIVSGLIAGVLAIMMLMGTLYYLEGELAGLEQILRGEGLIIVYGAVLVLGIVLAVLAAWFAVNRYMYMAVGKMYYI